MSELDVLLPAINRYIYYIPLWENSAITALYDVMRRWDVRLYMGGWWGDRREVHQSMRLIEQVIVREYREKRDTKSIDADAEGPRPYQYKDTDL